MLAGRACDRTHRTAQISVDLFRADGRMTIPVFLPFGDTAANLICAGKKKKTFALGGGFLIWKKKETALRALRRSLARPLQTCSRAGWVSVLVFGWRRFPYWSAQFVDIDPVKF